MIPATHEAIAAKVTRRDGHICAWLGRDTGDLVLYSRTGRNLPTPADHVWLDEYLTRAIHDDPLTGMEATNRGVVIEASVNPAHTRLYHAVHGPIVLSDNGGWTSQEVPF
jgi:hypothetical protein